MATLRKVRNTGAAISAGKAVALSGPSESGSDLYDVVEADPSDPSKMPAAGVAVWGIPSGQNNPVNGVIVTGGVVSDMLGMSGRAGTKIYVGAGGVLTTTPPSGAIQQEIGVFENLYPKIVVDVEEVSE